MQHCDRLIQTKIPEFLLSTPLNQASILGALAVHPLELNSVMVSVGCHEGCVGWLQEPVVCCCDFIVHSIMGELWLRCISSRLLKFKVYFLTWLGAVLTGRIHQWHFLQEPLRKWACWHGTLALDPLGHIDVCGTWGEKYHSGECFGVRARVPCKWEMLS